MQNNFEVEIRSTTGGTAVLSLSGELDLLSSPRLEEALRALDNSAAEVVVLDLRELEFMDSTGLHALVKAHHHAQESGRRLVLVRGRQQVQRLFELTGLAELLTIVDAPDWLLEAGRTPD